MTEILWINSSRPASAAIRRAVKVLDADGMVMYPTESSYALGVNALSRIALRRLFEAKARPLDKPVPVIVSDVKMWKKYAYFTRSAEALIMEFMPGPLTLALKKRSSVPDILNPNAIAARIPGHQVALALVSEANYPITSTSANISGNAPAYSVRNVPAALKKMIDLVLDVGKLTKREPSTIVDFTVRPRIRVTREGAIPASVILSVLTRRRGEK